MNVKVLNRKTLFVYAFLINCVLIMTQFSWQPWIKAPFALKTAIQFLLIGCSLRFLYKDKCHTKRAYLSAIAVLMLVLIGMFRGIFAVDGYWGYKGWINCSMSAITLVLLFPLGNPSVARRCLQMWNKYLWPVLFFFALIFATKDSFAPHLAPIYYFYLLFFFMTGLSGKVRLVIILGIIFVIVYTENRSGVIKTAGSLLLCSTLLLATFWRKTSLIILHFVFFLLPIVLLILGITGKFNIFKAFNDETPQEITVRLNGQDEETTIQKTDLTADTRTLLYEEVILSAIENDYVIFGNSVGRGNTHNGEWLVDLEGYDGSERLRNEVGILNTFTWMGLVGLILHTLMYLQASCLGLFFSKNRYVPVIACAVACHWALSWMEEVPEFTVMDFAFYLLMGICFSPWFRKMSDIEFRMWFKSCFTKAGTFTPYDALQWMKLNYIAKKLK